MERRYSMAISAIAGFSGFGSYRISSINGNPYSLNAVQKIGQDNGELEEPRSTASGDFAEMLGIQESMLSQKGEDRQTDYASYLNDTIGMMGLQNRLRDQLSGVGFTPFS